MSAAPSRPWSGSEGCLQHNARQEVSSEAAQEVTLLVATQEATLSQTAQEVCKQERAAMAALIRPPLSWQWLI